MKKKLLQLHLRKKQKKNKATVAPYQTNKQQGVEINILHPPSKETQSQPSGGTTLEHIGSNASDPEAQQVNFCLECFIFR